MYIRFYLGSFERLQALQYSIIGLLLRARRYTERSEKATFFDVQFPSNVESDLMGVSGILYVSLMPKQGLHLVIAQSSRTRQPVFHSIIIAFVIISLFTCPYIPLIFNLHFYFRDIMDRKG